MANTDISSFIEEFIHEFLDDNCLDYPWQVNNGDCEEFANAVAKEIIGAEALWDEDLDPQFPFGSHCFVRFEGRFYDSECSEGVDDWHDLPYYTLNPTEKVARAVAARKEREERKANRLAEVIV